MLPPIPRMEGLEAFDLYLWIAPVVYAAIFAIVVRLAIRRDGRRAWIALFLALAGALLIAIVYLPFIGMIDRRVDRVAGVVQEPVVAARALVANVLLALALAVLFLVSARLRHTPAHVQRASFTAAAILYGILLSLFFLVFLVPPISNDWLPVEQFRPDLLVPFRPCRGAMLWSDGDPPFLRIDDVWPDGVISANGWREQYFWLTRAEAESFRVRIDDPAVIRCDSRPRRETVAPAPWHRVGLELSVRPP